MASSYLWYSAAHYNIIFSAIFGKSTSIFCKYSTPINSIVLTVNCVKMRGWALPKENFNNYSVKSCDFWHKAFLNNDIRIIVAELRTRGHRHCIHWHRHRVGAGTLSGRTRFQGVAAPAPRSIATGTGVGLSACVAPP